MIDDIIEMVAKANKAFEEYQYWPQEKVDEVVQAVGWIWQKEEVRKVLARTAVDESGIGKYEDKLAKIKTKTLGTLWDQRGAKTCDLVEEDKSRGIRRYAKPIGVIADVVPCTNPESTICCIGLSTLKTRNAMIVSPHPRTQKSSYLTVEYGREALKKIGAPVDLLQCIKNTSHAKTQELMAHCDFAVATGGAALVKVVYEAGKPAQTVSAGNVVSIIDETVPDLQTTARKIMISKVANNSASCSSENAIAIHESIYDKMIECLEKEGGYLCNNAEREDLRKCLWPDGKTINRDIVARSAALIADIAGLKVPPTTKFLMVSGEKIGPEDRFSGEKLSPVLTVWKWNDFDEMLDRLEQILEFSGKGHSVSIHTELDDRRVKLALRSKVGRVVCNMGHTAANSGGWGAGLPFTDTLGGGTWAGNMTSENVNWRHFLNYTLVAMPIPEYIPEDEELFSEYLKKWGRD